MMRLAGLEGTARSLITLSALLSVRANCIRQLPTNRLGRRASTDVLRHDDVPESY